MRHYINLIESAKHHVDLPVLSFKNLWHVGYLRANDKRDGSYEGAGLSVSMHPDAWRQIAPQVGGHTYRCIKPSNSFIAAYACTKDQVESLKAWGKSCGWVEDGSVWTITAYDEYAQRRVRTNYGNQTDFERDWRFFQKPDNAGAKAVFTTKPGGVSPSSKLNTRTRTKAIDARHAIDMLLTVYAEDVMRVDGVWWKDRLSPDNLSAPRGVIVPSMIESWKFDLVQTDEQSGKGRLG